jgi:coatomer subunit beta
MRQKKALAKKEQASRGTGIQADDLISFRQLSKKSAGGDLEDVSFILAVSSAEAHV